MPSFQSLLPKYKSPWLPVPRPAQQSTARFACIRTLSAQSERMGVS